MLNTLEATLSPSGTLRFVEEVHLTYPIKVLVTLLHSSTSTDITDSQRDQPPAMPPFPVNRLDDLPGAMDGPTPLATIALLAEGTPPRTALWAQLAALRDQAQQEGVLPESMTWDEILAEAALRRNRSHA